MCSIYGNELFTFRKRCKHNHQQWWCNPTGEKNGIEKDSQEDSQIRQYKNEKNKSIILCETVDASKTIEPNLSKTIKPKVRNTIEKLRANKGKPQEVIFAYIPHFKYFLTNLPTPSFTTTFGINIAEKISILATDQSADTNRTSMEHLSLLAKNIGLKYITIGIV